MRCPTCGARHTTKNLARKVVREARLAAHEAFDSLWDGPDAPFSRTDAYRWLARVMDLPVRKAHIRYFDVDQCATVRMLVRAFWLSRAA